jgi:hypothetical protein
VEEAVKGEVKGFTVEERKRLFPYDKMNSGNEVLGSLKATTAANTATGAKKVEETDRVQHCEECGSMFTSVPCPKEEGNGSEDVIAVISYGKKTKGTTQKRNKRQRQHGSRFRYRKINWKKEGRTLGSSLEEPHLLGSKPSKNDEFTKRRWLICKYQSGDGIDKIYTYMVTD